MTSPFIFFFFFFLLFLPSATSAASCSTTCDLALASYYVTHATGDLTYVASLFNLPGPSAITPYNNLSSPDSIIAGTRISVPLTSCTCSQTLGSLAHTLSYQTLGNDSYTIVATDHYSNLTTVGVLEAVNSYPANLIPIGANLNVTVNCSCGNAAISEDYGLFETYPLRSEDTLASVAAAFEFGDGGRLIQKYNPGVNFSAGKGIVFVPTKGDGFVSFHAIC